MRNKSRWLALMLTGSMMISPLSYTRTYAAENEQQYETNLQETVEVEEADTDKKQDESQIEDAGNVKEDQTEESDKVDNSSDKSDDQNSIEAETKPNLENNSENNSENNLENNSEEKDTETTGKNPGTTVSDQVADEKTDNKDTQIKDETGKSEPSTDSNDSTNTPEPELPPLQEAPSVTGESVKVVKEDAEEFKMFKVSESTVVEKDGELDITIKTNNTGFDALYLGSKDDLLKASIIEGTKDEEGAWTFHFNVPKEKAGQTIPVSLRKSKDQTWYDKQYLWMYIPNPGETSTPDPAPTPTPTPDPVPNPNPAPEATVANGIYSMDVTSSSSMFKVVDCILTAKDGKMSAVLTLSGTGYGYLYMGTKEEAASADQSSWIPYQVNKEGKYTVYYVYGKQKVKAEVEVKDTKAPELKMKDSYTTELPKDIKPEDFVESVKDASDVTLEFVGQDSWEKKGKYGVTVAATDSDGHKTEGKSTLNLEEDTTGPTIEGADDILDLFQKVYDARSKAAAKKKSSKCFK